jgi:hypothetical protein
MFSNKGIYEASVLHESLDSRFPRSMLLSHALIKGANLRTGLFANSEVINDYQSHCSAQTHRKHCWVPWQFVHHAGQVLVFRRPGRPHGDGVPCLRWRHGAAAGPRSRHRRAAGSPGQAGLRSNRSLIHDARPPMLRSLKIAIQTRKAITLTCGSAMWTESCDLVDISGLEVEINANGQFEALDEGLWGNTMVPKMTLSFISSTVCRSHSLIVTVEFSSGQVGSIQVSQLPLNSAWILTFAQTVDPTVDVEVHSNTSRPPDFESVAWAHDHKRNHNQSGASGLTLICLYSDLVNGMLKYRVLIPPRRPFRFSQQNLRLQQMLVAIVYQ